MKTRYGDGIRVLLAAAFAILVTACNLPGREAAPVPATEPPPPTDSPSATKLPPIPEFDELLYLAFGGGGGPITPCDQPYETTDDGLIYSGDVPAVFIAESFFAPASPVLCIWARNFDTPVQVSLASPDGQITLRATFTIDQASGSTTLDTATGGSYFHYRPITANRENLLMELMWPQSLPAGKWSLLATGSNWQAQSVYEAIPPGKPTVEALDVQYLSTFLPFDISAHYPVGLTNSGGVILAGHGFLPDQPVYLLVYRENLPEAGSAAMQLTHKMVVIADENGSFATEVNAPFEAGQLYRLLALTADTIPSIQSEGRTYLDSEAYIPQSAFVIRSP